jgi:hypothetical protein
MKTKNKETSSDSEDKKTTVKISKTWLAFQKHIGTGKIIDMRAVLK